MTIVGRTRCVRDRNCFRDGALVNSISDEGLVDGRGGACGGADAAAAA